MADRGVASSVSSVDEALATILAHVRALPVEEVSLAGAAGRAIAADVTAAEDLWPFPRAAMDGYAVRAEDTALASAGRPEALRVAGEIVAGAGSGPAVTPGTAVRIATGAAIPAGADAVIPWEQIREGEGVIFIDAPIPAGKHVFPAGEDAHRGEVVLQAGTALRGGHLALLASLGMTRVSVVRRARVAILTAGDELVNPETTPMRGQVRDSNSTALAAEIQRMGATALPLGIARDHLEDLVPRIHRGLQADALIVCAGMSVGERDLVKEAFARAGVQLLFWRVAMKPGAPAAFGISGATPVFGLPGNPGAAMVAFEELVRPALAAMMGFRDHHRPVLRGRLLAPVLVAPGRRRYLWARAVSGPDGVTVQPLRGQGTATLRSVSDANALLTIPPETAELRRGDSVPFQLLADLRPTSEGAGDPPILSIVGARNAGKTRLIEQLVPELHRRGYRVGVIKHDAHRFEMDRPGTDTWRFAAAGADAVAIVDPEKVAVIQRAEGQGLLGSLHDTLRNVDLILVEGYSQEPIPKVEVRRSDVVSDKPAPLGPIIAVVSHDDHGDGLVVESIPALVERLEAVLLLTPTEGTTSGNPPALRPRPGGWR